MENETAPVEAVAVPVEAEAALVEAKAAPKPLTVAAHVAAKAARAEAKAASKAVAKAVPTEAEAASKVVVEAVFKPVVVVDPKLLPNPRLNCLHGPEPMTEVAPAEAEAVSEAPVGVKTLEDPASAKSAPAPAISASAPERSAPAPVKSAPVPAKPASTEVESTQGGLRRGPSCRGKRRPRLQISLWFHPTFHVSKGLSIHFVSQHPF